MDYKGHLCPLCNKAFEKDDDIVVCPYCGTPHHRECYEQNGKCANDHRHRESYDYQREREVNADVDVDTVCRACGSKNPTGSKYCNTCGSTIASEEPASSKSQESEQNPYTRPEGSYKNVNSENPDDFSGAPFGNGVFVIDPMGGVKPEDDLGDGVTAAEASRFVKSATTHYIPQFKQIYERGRARFSFVGFIFSGGWMLYRKMYKLGAFFTALIALLLLAQTYIEVIYKAHLESALDTYNSIISETGFNVFRSYDIIGRFFSQLSTEQTVIFVSYLLIAVLTLAVRIICGVMGNKWYYRHSIKTISKIKESTEDTKKRDEIIEARGGLNMPLTFSLMISYAILLYLPYFF